jgi:Predicted nucleotide-binding protein containing TIR-like domain
MGNVTDLPVNEQTSTNRQREDRSKAGPFRLVRPPTRNKLRLLRCRCCCRRSRWSSRSRVTGAAGIANSSRRRNAVRSAATFASWQAKPCGKLMSSETSSVLVPYAVNSFCTMDKTIRKNEICIIGLPRCDFVFSSTRSCFIAYGFRDSTLEMTILRHLLEQKGIVPVEAGGSLAPGQHAFCAKICSKIITSQFCIVLINNEETERGEIPNANVNMEYGLMVGFNKYIIPFQRASQTLPFNIAGLDTIKYNNQDFERLASTAIEQAIQETRQDAPQTLPVDQGIWNFPAC